MVTLTSEIGRNVDAAAALRAKIFRILVGDKTPSNAYLSFIAGGHPQNEYTLSFMTDPNETALAHDFAMITNSIPLSVGDWVQSSNVIWNIYGDWITKYEAPKKSLTKAEEKQLKENEEIVEDLSDKYWDLRSAYDNAFSDWYGWYVMPINDRPPDYQRKLEDAKRKMEAAGAKWDLIKGKYETAAGYVINLTTRDPEYTRSIIKKQFGAPLPSGNGIYYPTRITPPNILEPSFTFQELSEELGEPISWPKYTFFHNETKETKKEEEYKWGGSGGIGALLWSASGENEGIRQVTEKNTDISKLEISFEMIRTPIIRPWFTSFLLASRGWKWPDATQDNPQAGIQFSDGNIPNTGSWPMIPTEAIFIRNLVVKMDMSSEINKKSLTETKSAASAGWGMFKIKGSVATKNGKEEFCFEETSDGITCPQPQIIAYFCQIFPVLPNPDWSLWEMGQDVRTEDI